MRMIDQKINIGLCVLQTNNLTTSSFGVYGTKANNNGSAVGQRNS